MAKKIDLDQVIRENPERWEYIKNKEYLDLFSDMTPDQQEEILRQTRENEAKEKKHK